jgi:DNA-binding transcriptional regulator LsrR (DeoR family)
MLVCELRHTNNRAGASVNTQMSTAAAHLIISARRLLMGEVPETGQALSTDEIRLALLAARRYYFEDRSKVAIAAELGVSRFKVARLLDRARAEGLVTVVINEPGAVELDLSTRLATQLGLQRVIVADPIDAQSSVPAVAGQAAAHLRNVVMAGSFLGIAWSRAVRALSDQLSGLPPCTVVQLCGVLPRPAGEEHNVELVRRAAQACGGNAVTFYAPLVLPDAATARTLRAQPGIADALSACDRVSVAVIAVGHWKAGSSTVYDALGPAHAGVFTRRGAIAESCGMLFDADGKVLRAGLQKRVVAISESQLRNVDDVIALATEPERAEAIRAIARSGLVTTLVTHRAVAERLLNDSN